MGNYKVSPIQFSCSWNYFFVLIILCLTGVLKGENLKTDDVSSLEDYNDEHRYRMILDSLRPKNDDGNFIGDDNHCRALTFLQVVKMASPIKPKTNCFVRYSPYDLTDDDEQLNKLIKIKLGKDKDAFDLRDIYPNCPSLKEVSNQGDCDSCWAVAATDVMTDRLCIKSNGRNRTRYSAADVLSCCPYCKLEGERPGACTSIGMHGRTWPYWVEFGIVSGHYHNTGEPLNTGCRNYKIDPCYHIQMEAETGDGIKRMKPGRQCSVKSMECPKPTKEKEPRCHKNPKKRDCDSGHTGLPYLQDLMKGKTCYILNRQFDGMEGVIKLEIKLNGPVHIIMTAYESFFKMFSNKTEDPKKAEPYLGPQGRNDMSCLAHSIRVVGWGKKGTKNYWIAANSWGENWGDNGFFHLDFNHDSPNIFSDYKNKVKGDKRVFAGIPEIK